MIRVCIESPLAGNFRRNVRYAQLCMLDSLKRGEAPYLSHLLYPQVYDDLDSAQREFGMRAGRVWLQAAELVVLYTDLGISNGMEAARDLARELGRPVQQRMLVDYRGAPFVRSFELTEALAEDPAQWATRLR